MFRHFAEQYTNWYTQISTIKSCSSDNDGWKMPVPQDETSSPAYRYDCIVEKVVKTNI